jgi:hypothetical protein
MEKVAVIQPLWEGYGVAERVTNADGTSTIVKRVKPPPGRTGLSHERKVMSYRVEAAFYASELPSKLCAAGAAVALPASSFPPPSHEQISLTDLTATHAIQRQKAGLSTSELKAALRWAANLHAATWEGSGGLVELLPSLWPTGTFFRLQTRHEELETLSAAAVDGGDSSSLLARVAKAVDWRLRGVRTPPRPGEADDGRLVAGASGWALLHGDLKAPNLFFSAEAAVPASPGPASAAACDFQYTGPGCVMLDVAYLLCNSARAEQLADGKDSELVACYVEELARARERQGGLHADGAAAYSYTMARAHREYRLAVADYARFLAGWCRTRGREPPAYAMEIACGVAKEVVALAEGAEAAAGADDVNDPSDDSSLLNAVWLAFPDAGH